MAIEVLGGVSGASLEVNDTHDALRAALYPREVVGSYRISQLGGTYAAGTTAGVEAFHLRNASSVNRVAINKVTVRAMSLGTGFTAGSAQFELLVARSWTADGSGGTAATLTGNNAKKRSSFDTLADLTARIHSTGALTAGTKTLDTVQMAHSLHTVGTAANTVFADVALLDGRPGEYPIILAQNEGIVIEATVPATGTWSALVTVDFDVLANAAF